VPNTKQNSSDNLPSYLQTNIIGQILSIRGEGAEFLDKLKEAHDLLAACGTQLPVTQDVISDLEKSVMQYVYGDTKSKSFRDMRAAKWRAQKKKNTIRLLVPNSHSLHQHLACANYLAYLLKHYKLQNHPS